MSRVIIALVGAKAIGFDCPAEVRFARTQGSTDTAEVFKDLDAIVEELL